MSRTGIVAILAAILGVGVFLHTLFYSEGWNQRARLRADLEVLEAQNRTTERQVADLREQVEALRTDPEVQERAVRHELGYVKPGEVVLELGESR